MIYVSYNAYMGDIIWYGHRHTGGKSQETLRHKKPMTHGVSRQFWQPIEQRASAKMLPSGGHKVSIWWSPSLRMQSMFLGGARWMLVPFDTLKLPWCKDHLKVSAVVMGGNGFQSGLQFRFVKYDHLALDARELKTDRLRTKQIVSIRWKPVAVMHGRWLSVDTRFAD